METFISLLSSNLMATESAPITTVSGYMNRFWQLVSENQQSRSPMRDAFRALEGELSEQYNVRRYKSYNSFAATRCKRPRRAALKTV